MPDFSASTTKGPPTRRPEALKRPLASVVTFLVVPEGTWRISTSAPATGLPAASSTRPDRPADVFCAIVGEEASREASTSGSTRTRSRLFIVSPSLSLRAVMRS